MGRIELCPVALVLLCLAGCATLPAEDSLNDAMEVASNVGHDFLSGSSEFLEAAVEGSFALIGADVDILLFHGEIARKPKRIMDQKGRS